MKKAKDLLENIFGDLQLFLFVCGLTFVLSFAIFTTYATIRKTSKQKAIEKYTVKKIITDESRFEWFGVTNLNFFPQTLSFEKEGQSITIDYHNVIVQKE